MTRARALEKTQEELKKADKLEKEGKKKEAEKLRQKAYDRRESMEKDWKSKYGDSVLGFESLIEPPRTAELYKKDKWTYLGKTKGYTCKRVSGEQEEKFSGKRVWDYSNLRPKLVYARKI